MSIENERARETSGTQITTSNWKQNSYLGNPRTQPAPQPMSTTNRYSMLAELHEPEAEHEANPRGIKGTQNEFNPHTYKRKQLQDITSARNNITNLQGRKFSQHPIDYKILRREQRNQVNCDTEHNLTSKNHRCKPLVSSNTSTTASVIVTPTDNNAAHLIPNLLNGVVSEPANSKVKLSNTNADGMLNLINELKI